MYKNSVDFAVAYYQAMQDKNISFIEKHVNPDIQFISPIAETKGKTAYLEAVKKFIAVFNKLTIRAQLDAPDQATLIYDVDFPAPIGHIRTAALMTFKDNLVTRIELFFDASSIKQN